MADNFYIVDVFAIEKYTGNQLAVVLNAGDFSSEQMLKIACEMNYSETTFVLSDKEKNGGYDVRIFTPNEELPFAGHPTLGTAFIIGREIIKKPLEQIKLNLKVGQIPVTFEDDDVLRMKQKPPVFGSILDASMLADVLNVAIDDIDTRFPIQEVSTGIPCVIVSLKSLQALQNARVNQEKYFKLIEKLNRDFVSESDDRRRNSAFRQGRGHFFDRGTLSTKKLSSDTALEQNNERIADSDTKSRLKAKAILIFCPETINKQNHLQVRLFADYYGVPEDPATGSANGCLAGYLAKYNYFNGNLLSEEDLRVEQGYQINRPSLLRLRAKEITGEIEINVGGKVIMVAEGKLVQ